MSGFRCVGDELRGVGMEIRVGVCANSRITLSGEAVGGVGVTDGCFKESDDKTVE